MLKALPKQLIVKLNEHTSENSFILLKDDRTVRNGEVVSIGENFIESANINIGDKVVFADSSNRFTHNDVTYYVVTESTLYYKDQ